MATNDCTSTAQHRQTRPPAAMSMRHCATCWPRWVPSGTIKLYCVFVNATHRIGPSDSVMKNFYKAEQRCYRSEEHTSELQSLMRISYAVFCLKKKINI